MATVILVTSGCWLVAGMRAWHNGTLVQSNQSNAVGAHRNVHIPWNIGPCKWWSSTAASLLNQIVHILAWLLPPVRLWTDPVRPILRRHHEHVHRPRQHEPGIRRCRRLGSRVGLGRGARQGDTSVRVGYPGALPGPAPYACTSAALLSGHTDLARSRDPRWRPAQAWTCSGAPVSAAKPPLWRWGCYLGGVQRFPLVRSGAMSYYCFTTPAGYSLHQTKNTSRLQYVYVHVLRIGTTNSSPMVMAVRRARQPQVCHRQARRPPDGSTASRG